MDRKVKAYTTIEVIIILAIIGVLAGLFIKEFINYIANERLKEGLNQLLADIEYVKNKASISALPWGIRGCKDTNKYKIFMDRDGNCRDESPTCDTIITTTYCANKFNSSCTTDANCDNIPNTCVPLESVRTLPTGVIFSERTFYVVFDRKGWAFNYSCGNGENNATLKSEVTGKRYNIVVDRLGRIRVATQ